MRYMIYGGIGLKTYVYLRVHYFLTHLGCGPGSRIWVPHYWCIPCPINKSCARSLQYKDYHLGTFPDALSAAICQDRESLRIHRLKGSLNFPCGCKHDPALTSLTRRPAMLRGVRAPRQERPANNIVNTVNMVKRLIGYRCCPSVLPRVTQGLSQEP